MGSHYNTGPYINFPNFGNSNLGKLPCIMLAHGMCGLRCAALDQLQAGFVTKPPAQADLNVGMRILDFEATLMQQRRCSGASDRGFLWDQESGLHMHAWGDYLWQI